MNRMHLLLMAGLLGAPGCGTLDPPDVADLDPDTLGQRACLLVAAAEYGVTGSLALVDPDSLQARPLVTTLHHDARLLWLADRLWVVNREGVEGNNLQVLGPDRWDTRWQRSTGPRSNPWHVALHPDGTRGVVALYGEGVLLPFGLPEGPDGPAEFRPEAAVTVDPGAERDGRAEVGWVEFHRGVLWVLAQGMGEYPWCRPGDRGRLLALDPDTMAPLPVFPDGTASLPLRACNPQRVHRLGDALWLVHAGNFRSLAGQSTVPMDLPDGGLEIVDLDTARSRGLVLSEARLPDVDLLDVIAAPDGRTWALVAGARFDVTLHPLDLETQSLGAMWWRADGEGLAAVRWWDERLWIADRTRGQHGLVVLDDRDGSPLTRAPIDLVHPPADLLIVEREGGCRRAEAREPDP
jgi:hypothetical protein